jgi:P-type conjugative transfer protein TrbJ
MRRCSKYFLVAARRMTLAGIAAAAVMAALPCPAPAQLAVQCVNCSTTWTQLLAYGKEVQQLATQVQSYATQLQQYANMVTNTVALPQEIWANVQSDIMQVRNLSNVASLLSGNTGSIVTRLQSASSYVNQLASLGNIGGQLTTWQQTIGNSVNTLGKTLGLQITQEQSDAALLAALQQHSQCGRADASHPGRQRTRPRNGDAAA